MKKSSALLCYGSKFTSGANEERRNQSIALNAVRTSRTIVEKVVTVHIFAPTRSLVTSETVNTATAVTATDTTTATVTTRPTIYDSTTATNSTSAADTVDVVIVDNI